MIGPTHLSSINSPTPHPTPNPQPPGPNDRHFANDMFKRMFLNENIWISNRISFQYVPGVWLTICQHWFLPGNKPLFVFNTKMYVQSKLKESFFIRVPIRVVPWLFPLMYLFHFAPVNCLHVAFKLYCTWPPQDYKTSQNENNNCGVDANYSRPRTWP